MPRNRAHQKGLDLIAEGKRQEGLTELQTALKLDPTNAMYRLDYRNQLAFDVAAAMRRGEQAQAAGDNATARAAYGEALKIDPVNESARRALVLLDQEQRMRAIVAEAERLADAGRPEAARDMLRGALADNPASATIGRALAQMQARVDKLEDARQAKSAAASVMKRPVTLQFRDANLRMVFEALSRTTGLNVILDRDVRADLKTTIFVKDAAVEDTVDLILLQNQLEKRSLNANTLFIYPATAGQAEGIPGPAGAHLPDHQRRRQVRAERAEDGPEGQGRLGRRAQRHAGDARHRRRHRGGGQGDRRARRARARGDARGRGARGRARPAAEPRHRVATTRSRSPRPTAQHAGCAQGAGRNDLVVSTLAADDQPASSRTPTPTSWPARASAPATRRRRAS